MLNKEDTSTGEHKSVVDDSHYRQMIEVAADVAYSINAQGFFTYVNPASEQLTGYTQQELIGAHFTVLVAKGWRKRLIDLYLKQIENHERVTRLEFPIRTKTGQKKWVEQIVTLAEKDGQVDGFYSIVRDVTVRREMEDTLRKSETRLALLQQVDMELNHTLDIQWVLLVALNSAMVLSNADAGGLGLIENDQLRFAQVSGSFPSKIMPLNQGIIGRAIRNQQSELVLDVTADPDYVEVLPDTRAEIAIPLIFRSTVVGVLELETSDPAQFNSEVFEVMKLLGARVASAIENARLYEISQAQLAELKLLYEQVSNLEQLKTDMIRLTAHDVRGPIGVIRGYVELIEQDLGAKAAENYQIYFTSIRRAVERVERMSVDILSLERIHAAFGKPQGIVDLREAVDRAVMDYRPASREKQQALETSLSAEHLQVQGDSTFLYEAVANLIGNAIKYTPTGGKIEVILRQVDGLAVFEVKDTGFGIPLDLQAKLFEPFYRVKTDETRNIDGTGLGLYLVNKIIKRHDGKMRFQSEHGKGSTFGFELPSASQNGSDT